MWSNPEELKSSLKDVTALVVRNRTKVTADVIAAAPKLKVIARAGVGLDNIDIKAADAAGVVVVAGLGANAVSVGELTLGLALALLRNVPGHDVATRDGGWVRTSSAAPAIVFAFNAAIKSASLITSPRPTLTIIASGFIKARDVAFMLPFVSDVDGI